MKWIAENLAQLDAIVDAFIKNMGENRVFAFEAEMGTGKTTFITRLINKLGCDEHISSPTYGYVKEYETDKAEIILHFDVYRLNSEDEAYDLGLEDQIYSGNICFIEWAKNIENLLPENTVWVKMNTNSAQHRIIEAEL